MDENDDREFPDIDDETSVDTGDFEPDEEDMRDPGDEDPVDEPDGGEEKDNTGEKEPELTPEEVFGTTDPSGDRAPVREIDDLLKNAGAGIRPDPVNSNTSPDIPKGKAQQDMSVIRQTMPEVWKMIIESNCCPRDLGLTDSCGFNTSCEKCWARSIDIYMPRAVVLSTDNRYLCSRCHKYLEFKEVDMKGRQIWACPKCGAKFLIPLMSAALSRIEEVKTGGDT